MNEENIKAGEIDIPDEVVEKEFERFCFNWDIDDEIDRMTKRDAEDFQSIKSQMLRYMRKRRVELGESDEIRVNLKFSSAYNEDHVNLNVTRLDIIVMDRHEDDHKVAKMAEIAAEGCGLLAKQYARIDPRDKKIIMKVVGLFLGS